MATKRSREDNELAERTLAMANYLIFLSRASQSESAGSDSGPGRVYECKTCNRQFQSFQALGGHRASHKKPKLSIGEDGSAENPTMEENLRIKTKTHACSICGLKFPIGQALGGHMRRHRAALTGSNSPTTFSLTLDVSSKSHSAEELSGVNKSRCINGDHDHDDHRRIKCLDLNLTPLENGLLEFGKLVPVVY